MTVRGLLSVTLEVPDLDPGVRFYTDAGLGASIKGDDALFRCSGQTAASIVLKGGHARKRLHHITLRAEKLEQLPNAVARAGGSIVSPPDGHAADGLWVRDPHGMLIHLLDVPAAPPLAPIGEPFAINAPGRIVRVRRSAILPAATYPAAQPLRLGHTLLFTPDVHASVAFMTEGLRMGLTDHAQDVIAFCCARSSSDHHVVAFAKSSGVGFHHVSFQMSDPDAVGRAGRDLREKAGKGDWGFGRHAIGSNFFHYIQDPWGSWFEYYSDIDFIDDYALWKPTNYALEDSLASWGPEVPHDFVHNYELD